MSRPFRGAGRRALKSLADQNRQQCPVCSRPGGYLATHQMPAALDREKSS